MYAWPAMLAPFANDERNLRASLLAPQAPTAIHGRERRAQTCARIPRTRTHHPCTCLKPARACPDEPGSPCARSSGRCSHSSTARRLRLGAALLSARPTSPWRAQRAPDRRAACALTLGAREHAFGGSRAAAGAIEHTVFRNANTGAEDARIGASPNNPLTLTDPSGFMWMQELLAGLVGTADAVVGGEAEQGLSQPENGESPATATGIDDAGQQTFPGGGGAGGGATDEWTQAMQETGQAAPFTDPSGRCMAPEEQAVLAMGNIAMGAALNALGGAALEGVAGLAPEVAELAPEVAELAAEGADVAGVEGAEELVTVAHYTSTEGASAIEASGALRAGSYVTLPGETAGLTATEVETVLEIQSGRGAMTATLQTPASNLYTPANGPWTSGGALQAQIRTPVSVGPGYFVPTP